MDARVRHQARTAILHVRIVPALRLRIDDEAEALGVAPSALVRSILASHYLASK